MRTYDAIVVGAGHNGLTTAAFLAKAGLDVICVERNDYIGGATVSRNLYKDWMYSNCSYVCSLLRPEIYRALELHRIATFFHTRVLESRGEVEGRVLSFKELGDDELRRAEQEPAELLGRAQRVDVVGHVPDGRVHQIAADQGSVDVEDDRPCQAAT